MRTLTPISEKLERFWSWQDGGINLDEIIGPGADEACRSLRARVIEKPKDLTKPVAKAYARMVLESK